MASLLALAVASLSFGLERLLGPPGIAVAALTVMLLGQSSTGGAIGSAFQPGFYQAISELLPNGAAVTVLRNAIYFGGAHVAFPLLVIVTWTLAGTTIEFLADRRNANDRPALLRDDHDHSAAGSHVSPRTGSLPTPISSHPRR